jgi:hypothetical protein
VRYPLHKFGLEVGAPEVGPHGASHYQVDPSRDYEVIDLDSKVRRVLGLCRVTDADGVLTVEPAFPVDDPVVFWAEWDVNTSGTARLLRVILAMELGPPVGWPSSAASSSVKRVARAAPK